MVALTWHGKGDVRCESVPDPRIEHRRDAIIKVTACAICGPDLYLYDGVIPSRRSGDMLGQARKHDPADVAETGLRAMMHGDGDVVSGWPTSRWRRSRR